MLKRAFRAVKAALKWSKGYDQAAAGLHRDGIESLRAVYLILGLAKGDKKAPYDLNLLLGSVLVKVGHYCEAIRIISIADMQIENTSPLSECEKQYLRHIWISAIRTYGSLLSN
jgi:hypothetical protein